MSESLRWECAPHSQRSLARAAASCDGPLFGHDRHPMRPKTTLVLVLLLLLILGAFALQLLTTSEGEPIPVIDRPPATSTVPATSVPS